MCSANSKACASFYNHPSLTINRLNALRDFFGIRRAPAWRDHDYHALLDLLDKRAGITTRGKWLSRRRAVVFPNKAPVSEYVGARLARLEAHIAKAEPATGAYSFWLGEMG